MRAHALLLIVCLALACSQPTGPPPARVGTQEGVEDNPLIDENRRFALREDRDIENWVRRHRQEMTTTGTGLRYRLIRDMPGETAKPGQRAWINFAVMLINGDTAYASPPGEPRPFRIEHADVESGLHEGIQHLSVGDSAVLVIPSALAHGLVGDLERIPMRSTVIYYVGLVALEE